MAHHDTLPIYSESKQPNKQSGQKLCISLLIQANNLCLFFVSIPSTQLGSVAHLVQGHPQHVCRPSVCRCSQIQATRRSPRTGYRTSKHHTRRSEKPTSELQHQLRTSTA